MSETTETEAAAINTENARRRALAKAHALRVTAENLSHEATVLCSYLGAAADVRALNDQQRRVKRLATQVTEQVQALFTDSPVVVD